MIDHFVGIIEALAGFAIRIAPEIIDGCIDFMVWKNFSGDKTTSWEQWQGGAHHGEFAAQTKVIKSHVLILEQLEKHAPGSEALQEYRNLGMNLPDPKSDLFKKVKWTLSKALSPRMQNDDSRLIAAVNDSLDVLKGDKHAGERDAYSSMIKRSNHDPALRERISNFFKEFKGKQTEFYEAASKYEAQKSRLLIEGKVAQGPGMVEKLLNNFKNAGQAKQGAIVFAAVTSTSLLAYGIGRIMENKKRTSSHTEILENNRYQTAISL